MFGFNADEIRQAFDTLHSLLLTIYQNQQELIQQVQELNAKLDKQP